MLAFTAIAFARLAQELVHLVHLAGVVAVLVLQVGKVVVILQTGTHHVRNTIISKEFLSNR